MANVRKVENQGQGPVCQCKHHRLYHSSWGPCMVLNCNCQEWAAMAETLGPPDAATAHARSGVRRRSGKALPERRVKA